MTSRYTDIDLSALPAPDAVKPLSFEEIFSAIKADIVARFPAASDTIDLESEPLTKLAEAFAYRAFLQRAMANDDVRAVHLATATGADLENIAARFGVARLTVVPAQPDAQPPVVAVMETDTALRRRTQMALESFTTAGPKGAYEFHARAAHGEVVDVEVMSPEPGTVRLYILSAINNGSPSGAVLGAVQAAVNADDVRPLCDTVQVQAPTIATYTVNATITIPAAPGAATIAAAARSAVEAYTAEAFAIGKAVRRSALFAALHQEGVANAVITTPSSDRAAESGKAWRCTDIIITVVTA